MYSWSRRLEIMHLKRASVRIAVGQAGSKTWVLQVENKNFIPRLRSNIFEMGSRSLATPFKGQWRPVAQTFILQVYKYSLKQLLVKAIHKL